VTAAVLQYWHSLHTAAVTPKTLYHHSRHLEFYVVVRFSACQSNWNFSGRQMEFTDSSLAISTIPFDPPLVAWHAAAQLGSDSESCISAQRSCFSVQSCIRLSQTWHRRPDKGIISALFAALVINLAFGCSSLVITWWCWSSEWL